MEERLVMARPRPRKTAVCVLRIEARGETGVLITMTATSDVNTTTPGRTRTVGTIDEALALVAAFLCEYGISDVE